MTALPQAASAQFSALGTYVFVAVTDHRHLEDVVDITAGILAAVDRACSRFRDDSDLRRVNAGAGTWVKADPLLIAAVDAAVHAARDTDGLIDPLLGRVMVSMGYDRDFRSLPLVGRPATTVAPRPGAWRDIAFSDDAIRIPEGTALDLGSIGKAWASDLAAVTIGNHLGVDALISVGGDIAVSGSLEWPVDISERPDQDPDQTVWIREAGLATSSTAVRRWQAGDVVRHHLIDPRTGASAPDVWRTVSAIGPTCGSANTSSTAAIVLGDGALPWLEARGISARLVSTQGVVHTVGQWPEESE